MAGFTGMTKGKVHMLLVLPIKWLHSNSFDNWGDDVA